MLVFLPFRVSSSVGVTLKIFAILEKVCDLIVGEVVLSVV
jgi:hypothetical protein